MTSPVPVLCVVLLSVCAADARRLPRQFDVVQPDQAACVQDGVSYPIGRVYKLRHGEDRPGLPGPGPAVRGRCGCVPPAPLLSHWTCPNGSELSPSSRRPPIPAGQTVYVKGEQCHCAGMYAMCIPVPITTTTQVPTTTTTQFITP
ncbi:hypothetical protein Bbelb_343240 [Branchiostoma belcheri]|nr:hypothetical protein Bbelb_343240 [Branchiostoma belcheri]